MWPGWDCISSCLWFTGPVVPAGTTPAQHSFVAPRARCWDPSQCRAWQALAMLCSGHSWHTRNHSLRQWSLAAFFHSRSRRVGAVPGWGHSGEQESPSETLRGSQASLLFCSEQTQQFPVPNPGPSCFFPPSSLKRERGRGKWGDATPGTDLPAVSKARPPGALPWPPISRIRNLSYFVASHELEQQSGGCGLRERKSKGRRC